MTGSAPLTAAELRTHAAEAAAQPHCADCAALLQPGWESISGAMQTSHLQCIGALGSAADWEQLDEYHPHGTSLWSPDAPIALGWHPYTRCTLWRCPRCAGAFLRYTEYGGYYEDERIRPLQAGLIVEPGNTD
ncbi:hypothetical protein [Acidovorax sp. MR-S7]|uniref:hypothetical protein n=1 Tax=Acidovorax sp. MR-S7 TaxID=1268622 RepID=UPI0003702B74|nr:hypothetical protein [Acidovorax sp. MR-S7]GAD23990.1 hypothetical protein AVS7_03750 [Acidovorax sp. MR-S7]